MDPTTTKNGRQQHMASADTRPGTSLAALLCFTDTEVFLDALTTEALTHRAVCHPYLQALADGALLDLGGALRDFAMQYYQYTIHFPRFLTVVISKFQNPDHRLMLMDNLLEENGSLAPDEIVALVNHGIDPEWVQGIPHPELFRRFQRALGGSAGLDPRDDCIDVVCWSEVFYTILASGSAAEAVGAIGLGTEQIVKYIYRYLIRAIERYGKLDRAQYVFFELHCEVDDHHHETLLNIARDFAQTEEGRKELRKGMHKALNLRASFWDCMYRRALHHP